MLNEQGFLRVSIAATFVVATFGVVLGLLSGSFSISFDGVFSLVDAAMTALALWISSLIVRSAQREERYGKLHGRFTMGFWHLEPIVLLLNGSLLIAVAVYVLINAVAPLPTAATTCPDYAIIYAITVVACVTMALSSAGKPQTAIRRALDVRAGSCRGHRIGPPDCLHSAMRRTEPRSTGFLLCGSGRFGVGIACDHPRANRHRATGAVRHSADRACRPQGPCRSSGSRNGGAAWVPSYRAYVAKVGRAMQGIIFVVPKNLPAKPRGLGLHPRRVGNWQ
jgi:hypothetical protein